jgi:hypothetical protein
MRVIIAVHLLGLLILELLMLFPLFILRIINWYASGRFDITLRREMVG